MGVRCWDHISTIQVYYPSQWGCSSTQSTPPGYATVNSVNSTMERSALELFDLVDVQYEGRTLQIRPSQLTATNIARTFRLIPETIFLVSDRGTVALPTDGVFDDVDQCYTWSVEGDKSTANLQSRPGVALQSMGNKGSDRWKPQAFPLLSRSSRNSNMSCCVWGSGLGDGQQIRWM